MCDKCSICLEKLEEKGKVTFQCGHSLHLKCFMNCLKNDTIFCPLCRKKIEENVQYYNFLNLKLNRIVQNFKMITIKIDEIHNDNNINIGIDIQTE